MHIDKFKVYYEMPPMRDIYDVEVYAEDELDAKEKANELIRPGSMIKNIKWIEE